MSNEVLRNATYSTGSSSSSSYNPDDAPTSASIFSSAIDPTALHPLAGLTDKDLDYLLLDDDKISAVDGGQTVLPSRGWTDELCYGTGATYLAGKPPSSLEAVHPKKRCQDRPDREDRIGRKKS